MNIFNLKENNLMISIMYVVSYLILITTPVFIKDPNLSLSFLGVGFIFLLISSLAMKELKSIIPISHLLSAIILALSFTGFCSSTCGSLVFYEDVLGVSTKILAVFFHLFLALLTYLLVLDKLNIPEQIEDTLRGLGFGSSLFFGSILLINNSFCGICVSVHAIMTVSAIVFFSNYESRRIVSFLCSSIAMAGIVNAVFHHHPVPEYRNDPESLVSYMRSGWDRKDPITVIDQKVDNTQEINESEKLINKLNSEKRKNNEVNPDSQVNNIIVEDVKKTKPKLLRETITKEVPTKIKERTTEQAMLYGPKDAPILLTLAFDAGCHVCAAQAISLNDLGDDLKNRKISFRFLISHRESNSQVIATLIYAAGLYSEKAFYDTIIAMFSNQANIRNSGDALSFLPESFPSDKAMEVINRRSSDLEKIMDDAVRRKASIGFNGDPSMMLSLIENPSIKRTFSGLTGSEVIKIAIEDMLK